MWRKRVRTAQERYRISERRACGLYRFNRGSHRYRSLRSGQEALRLRLRELALARPRWGYRRLHILLRREGWEVNHKRVLRLYREEELMLRTRRRKKRVSESRLPAATPEKKNELWSIDFMADRLSDGAKYRVLTSIDCASRRCVGLGVERSFPSEEVTVYLDRFIERFGKPQGIQLDNGTEFTANAFDAWAHARGIALHFITPGKPTENGMIESFNGKLRAECLSASWFESLDQARSEIESWRTDYNEQRPHSSLGGRTPAVAAANLMYWAG